MLTLIFYVLALICFAAAAFNQPDSPRFDAFSGGVFFAFLGWLIASGAFEAGS